MKEKPEKEVVLNRPVTEYEIPKYNEDYLNENPHSADSCDKKEGPTGFARWLKASEEKIKRENQLKKRSGEKDSDGLPGSQLDRHDYQELKEEDE